MHILVTGGTGYIGSHTIIELLDAGHTVMAIDNFSNSHPEVLSRLQQITGHDVPFTQLDLCDQPATTKLFDQHQFDAVIHFAGLKAVGESVEQPLRYYHNNLLSTLNLVAAMQANGVNQLIFSSSATVYGTSDAVPFQEHAPLGATNPYGQTKLMIEQMLRDIVASDSDLSVSLLRYFNPIGAHHSGLIGEDPHGLPNNLLPFVSQVAVGRRDHLNIYGDDYDTPDGTGVRDYIHVVDLARGHVAALEHMPPAGTAEAYNLGTGQGRSVLEVIHAFEAASGVAIPYEVVARRPGDIATAYADPSKAQTELRWQAEKTLDDACADTWRWQSQNPTGYTSE
jgi:UDP-glucose 4-epimerase